MRRCVAQVVIVGIGGIRDDIHLDSVGQQFGRDLAALGGRIAIHGISVVARKVRSREQNNGANSHDRPLCRSVASFGLTDAHYPCGMSESISATKDALRQQILDKAVVFGKVILSSGREADYYVDLRRVTLDAEAAPLVGAAMLDATADLDYDAVGGLTLGADPVATAMMHAAAQRGRKLDAFVVRKEGKAHGLQRRIEGPDVAGRRVLAVEDTSTTGGSVLTAVEALQEAGAEVVAVAVIVERGARPKVTEAGLPYIAVYELADLDLA